MTKLSRSFYLGDAVTVAQKLLGKIIVRKFEDGTISRYVITETEAYLGEEDKACHASKGRTKRNSIMYAEGGKIYVYLIYGIHWMLNVVTGTENSPQAVLICGLNYVSGSGRAGRELKIDSSFYGEDLLTSERIFIEDALEINEFETDIRKGVAYAGEEWQTKQWRFIVKNK